MNRLIKFRAWLTNSKDITFSKGNHMDYDVVLVDGKYADVESGWDIQGTRDYPIMQYTGLKDKNGKEIYENDLVKSDSHNPAVYQIEFIEGGFCGTRPDLKGFPVDINHFYPSVGCEIEVIGNIYSNPDLIK
jgi:uncharacterized phage protein (TIGR01671 family)